MYSPATRAAVITALANKTQATKPPLATATTSTTATLKATATKAQATVEFALLLPLLFVFAAMLLQLGLIVKDQIALAHSTREGARALAAYVEKLKTASQVGEDLPFGAIPSGRISTGASSTGASSTGASPPGASLSGAVPYDQTSPYVPVALNEREAKAIVQEAVLFASDLDPTKTEVTLTRTSDDLIKIQVSYRSGTDVPLIGDWIFDVQLTSSLTTAIFLQ